MKEKLIADESGLPDYCVTAATLDYRARIDMQAIWQKHIDASISSTVNLPEAATVEDVENVYRYAWEKRLKGVTVFRDKCRRTGILTTGGEGDDKKAAPVEQHAVPGEHSTVIDSTPTADATREHPAIPTDAARDRPTVTTGMTEKVRIGCGNLYCTINRDEHGLCEVFTSLGRGGGCPSQSEATSRLISIIAVSHWAFIRLLGSRSTVPGHPNFFDPSVYHTAR